VFREAIQLLAVGLAAGVVLTLAAGRATAALLYGLAPNDWFSLVTSGLLLTVIALIASYIPARRAAAIDPIATLRAE
jgi:ABC-type antimicrobial peptide transport system permease subunit